MSKRLLVILFVAVLPSGIAGGGLFNMLLVYANRLGASPAVVGYLGAAMFGALVLGALAAGWAFARFRSVKLLLISMTLAGMIAIGLLTRVATIWQLIVLSTLAFFIAGVTLTLIRTLAGVYAGPQERGKVFGVLAVGIGLSTFIAGLTQGLIVDYWGFHTLFLVVAAILTIRLVASFFLIDKPVSAKRPKESLTESPKRRYSMAFYLLLAATAFVGVAGYARGLSIILLMDGQGYTTAAISSMSAVSGAIAMVFPFLIGWLSDRVGRKQILVISYLMVAMSLFITAGANSLWLFWLATALVAIFNSEPVGQAFVADLLPKEDVGRGMPLHSAMGWLAGVFGMVAIGHMIQRFGATATLLMGASLALVAMLLLLPICVPARPKEAALRPSKSATPS